MKFESCTRFIKLKCELGNVNTFPSSLFTVHIAQNLNFQIHISIIPNIFLKKLKGEFEKQTNIVDLTLHETLLKLKQAILRKVFSREIGYKTKYMTDETFRTVIKMFVALAYVPVDQVQAVAQVLFRHALAQFPEEAMERFIQYFQFTWTGVGGSDGGRFKLEFWNVRDR